MWCQSGFLAFCKKQKVMKAQTGNSDRALLGVPVQDGEQGQAGGPPLAPQGGGGSRDEPVLALEGRRGVCPRVRQQLALVVCPLLWWYRVPGVCTVDSFYSGHLVFAPCSSEVVIRFFGLFVSYCLHFALTAQFSSVQFSSSVVSGSLWPHELQHARPPCPSPTPGIHPNSTSIESVRLSSHLILSRPLLLLPPIPPSISLFQWVNSLHEVPKELEFQL